jgi:hypothetical protein
LPLLETFMMLMKNTERNQVLSENLKPVSNLT